MRKSPFYAVLLALAMAQAGQADWELLETHCAQCHDGEDAPAGFTLAMLGKMPQADSRRFWTTSWDYVRAGEMPPPDDSELDSSERAEILAFLAQQLRTFDESQRRVRDDSARRLNNRELAASLRDVLGIEDVGTHQPLASLLGDTRQDGFDTSGDALGMSEFHLEQYLDAYRRVLDSTLFRGSQPKPQRIEVAAADLKMSSRSQRRRRERANRTQESIDFLDPRLRVSFANFPVVKVAGRYRLTIRAKGVDRGVYPADATGVYAADPIRLRVHLGDRIRDFDLPDEQVEAIELDEWLSAGTRIELSYPTDGLRFRGNGNFKFQYAIAHDHLQEHDPSTYQQVLEDLGRAPARTRKNPKHWSHWTKHWQGPRPRLFSAVVEGPFYDAWPPSRHVALIGRDPRPEDAAAILRPVAMRAWRRDVSTEELKPLIDLVQSQAPQLGTVGAFQEGLVGILASPSFLLIQPDTLDAADRFAAKLSYFLRSTTPSDALRQRVRKGELQGLAAVRAAVQQEFAQGHADPFLRAFPYGWLQLDRVNFMAPDPDRYPFYHRKQVSDDMIAEVRRFFAHVVEENLPVTELLAADYSFLNADLAQVYGQSGVPQDSVLRKHVFEDGRRGGLLGMGAFLTLTADSLGTSPIHRAVYVMENFFGLHAPPPPGDVEIAEPDVRAAKTIKQVLTAHRADPSCAACHQRIDPFGYAFEEFDPVGSWRANYTGHIAAKPPRRQLQEILRQDRQRAAEGLPPLPKAWQHKPIPVDAAATLPGGHDYDGIVEFRQHMTTPVQQERFVRCFVTKLLTYANGRPPTDFTRIQEIVETAARHDYRALETIAAVVHSPLFRE